MHYDLSLQERWERRMFDEYDNSRDEYAEEMRWKENRATFAEQWKQLNTDEYLFVSEQLSCDDLFWLAIGSGDYSQVEKMIDQAIDDGVEKLYEDED